MKVHRAGSPVLAFAMALATVACGQTAEPTASSAAFTATESPRGTPAPATPAPSASPTPSASDGRSPAPARATPWTTVPGGWTQVAAFGDGEEIVHVIDLAAWSGGFIAIGLAQRFEESGEVREPRIWTSADGVEWHQTNPDLGSPDVEVTGMLVPDDGGVVIVGIAGRRGSGREHTAAWRSADAVTWTPYELPDDSATTTPDVGAVSGPLGHLLKMNSTVWYSSDLASWERVLDGPDDTWVSAFDAGDEGFVATAGSTFASGDGRTWYEAAGPEPLIGVTASSGDWYASAYTDEPSTISILRSANGLDWSPVLDVNDLTPPDGPKAGLGMESGITGASLAADAGVLMLSLTWNHCCVLPEQGVAVFASVDGASWSPASLPDSAVVRSIAGSGDMLVIAGQVGRGEQAVFWVAER